MSNRRFVHVLLSTWGPCEFLSDILVWLQRILYIYLWDASRVLSEAPVLYPARIKSKTTNIQASY